MAQAKQQPATRLYQPELDGTLEEVLGLDQDQSQGKADVTFGIDGARRMARSLVTKAGLVLAGGAFVFGAPGCSPDTKPPKPGIQGPQTPGAGYGGPDPDDNKLSVSAHALTAAGIYSIGKPELSVLDSVQAGTGNLDTKEIGGKYIIFFDKKGIPAYVDGTTPADVKKNKAVKLIVGLENLNDNVEFAVSKKGKIIYQSGDLFVADLGYNPKGELEATNIKKLPLKLSANNMTIISEIENGKEVEYLYWDFNTISKVKLDDFVSNNNPKAIDTGLNDICYLPQMYLDTDGKTELWLASKGYKQGDKSICKTYHGKSFDEVLKKMQQVFALNAGATTNINPRIVGNGKPGQFIILIKDGHPYTATVLEYCGDHQCNGKETADTCPADCKPVEVDAGPTDAGSDAGSTDTTTTPDAGTPDAGTPDAGTPDAGTPDAGTPDAGTPDAGTPDAGTPDAGTPDAGTPDAGTPDAGTPDAGTPDAGTPDAGTPDTGTPDAGTPDAGTPDAGTPDAGTPDSGTPDTSQPDTTQPDTTQPDTAQPDIDTTPTFNPITIAKDNCAVTVKKTTKGALEGYRVNVDGDTVKESCLADITVAGHKTKAQITVTNKDGKAHMSCLFFKDGADVTCYGELGSLLDLDESGHGVKMGPSETKLPGVYTVSSASKFSQVLTAVSGPNGTERIFQVRPEEGDLDMFGGELFSHLQVSAEDFKGITLEINVDQGTIEDLSTGKKVKISDFNLPDFPVDGGSEIDISAQTDGGSKMDGSAKTDGQTQNDGQADGGTDTGITKKPPVDDGCSTSLKPGQRSGIPLAIMTILMTLGIVSRRKKTEA